MPTEADWQRLGALLVARRSELGYGGKKRAAFARDRGESHTRTIDDMENARRGNYEPATLARMEQIYEWAPGSIGAVLAGHDPTPVTRPGRPTPASAEELIRKIWADERIPEDRKSALVQQVRRAEADQQAVVDEVARWQAV